MKVRITTEQLVLRNVGTFSRGQVVDLKPMDALNLIRCGYAEEVTEQIETREPELESRDTKPKKKGKKYD